MRRARSLAFVFLAPLLPVAAENLVLTIPPVKMSLSIQNQPIGVTVSGSVSGVAAARDSSAFHLRLTADLSDLQQNITVLLGTQLNRSEKCGERLSINRATLVPSIPAGILTADLRYEKWACAKVFGRDVVKRLVAGNGTVTVRLTPTVEDNRTVRLQSEIGPIQADGSLGEALRSGSLGPLLRDKIRTTLASVLDKANFQATIPAELQPVTVIHSAQFTGSGGRLCLELAGDVRISTQQLRLLIDQRRASALTH
jgi:hypothetical protein